MLVLDPPVPHPPHPSCSVSLAVTTTTLLSGPPPHTISNPRLPWHICKPHPPAHTHTQSGCKIRWGERFASLCSQPNQEGSDAWWPVPLFQFHLRINRALWHQQTPSHNSPGWCSSIVLEDPFQCVKLPLSLSSGGGGSCVVQIWCLYVTVFYHLFAIHCPFWETSCANDFSEGFDCVFYYDTLFKMVCFISPYLTNGNTLMRTSMSKGWSLFSLESFLWTTCCLYWVYLFLCYLSLIFSRILLKRTIFQLLSVWHGSGNNTSNNPLSQQYIEKCQNKCKAIHYYYQYYYN